MANESPQEPSRENEVPNKKAPGSITGKALRLRQVLIPIIVIALAAIIAGLGLGRLGRENPEPHSEFSSAKPGGTLPDFTVRTLDGKELRLAQLGAKVVLINFWATWCGSCMVEMPSIVQLRNDYHPKGFEVLAVNLDEDPAAAAPDAIRKLGMSFPTVTDPDSKLSEILDVHAIPFTAVVDRSRRILMVHKGERDWNSPKFRAQLEQWLSSN